MFSFFWVCLIQFLWSITEFKWSQRCGDSGFIPTHSPMGLKELDDRSCLLSGFSGHYYSFSEYIVAPLMVLVHLIENHIIHVSSTKRVAYISFIALMWSLDFWVFEIFFFCVFFSLTGRVKVITVYLQVKCPSHPKKSRNCSHTDRKKKPTFSPKREIGKDIMRNKTQASLVNTHLTKQE